MDYTLQFISTQWGLLGALFAFDPVLLSEPGIVFRLVLLVVLLCGSAFFSGSETALFSLSRLDLQQLRRERNPHSETLLKRQRNLLCWSVVGNRSIRQP